MKQSSVSVIQEPELSKYLSRDWWFNASSSDSRRKADIQLNIPKAGFGVFSLSSILGKSRIQPRVIRTVRIRHQGKYGVHKLGVASSEETRMQVP